MQTTPYESPVTLDILLPKISVKFRWITPNVTPNAGGVG